MDEKRQEGIKGVALTAGGVALVGEKKIVLGVPGFEGRGPVEDAVRRVMKITLESLEIKRKKVEAEQQNGQDGQLQHQRQLEDPVQAVIHILSLLGFAGFPRLRHPIIEGLGHGQ